MVCILSDNKSLHIENVETLGKASRLSDSGHTLAVSRLDLQAGSQEFQSLGITQFKSASITDSLAAIRSASANSDPVQQVNKKSDQELEGRAQKIHKAMHGGLTGMGTDEEMLFEGLEGLSPADVKRLKEIYKDRFNKDLYNDIESEVSGADLTRAKSLLESDSLQAKVTALNEAMAGAGTDEQAIKDIIQNLSDQERKELSNRYRQTWVLLPKGVKPATEFPESSAILTT